MYCTFYADPQLDEDLKELDGDRGSLALALSTAQDQSKPIFAKYGLRTIGGSDWITLNQENWGILLDKEDNTRYVGTIKFNRPHGLGTMTYINGTTYTGNFIHGNRDGIGRLVKQSSMQPTILEDGPFMDNVPSFDQTLLDSTYDTAERFWYDVIEVKIFEDSDVVDSAVFCVSRNNPPYDQVQKIARVFGWTDGDRFRLTPVYKPPKSGGASPQLGAGSGKRMGREFSIVANGSNAELESIKLPKAGSEQMWWPNVSVQENGRWKHILNYDGYDNPSEDSSVAIEFEPLEVHAIRE
jgi:hypothetical protein